MDRKNRNSFQNKEMSPAEALLVKALQETLEKEIELVPQEEEIKKMYSFSFGFEKKIQQQHRSFRLHRVWKYANAAVACLLAVLIFYNIVILIEMKSGHQEYSSLRSYIIEVNDSIAADANEEKLYENEAENPVDDADEIIEEAVQAEDEEEVSPTASDGRLSPWGQELPAATDKVLINVEQETINRTGTVDLNIQNITNEEIVYGESYSVEVNRNGEWHTINFKDKEKNFKAIGNIIMPGQTNTFSVNLDQNELDIDYTHYRVVIEIDNEYMAAEFTVE